MSHAEPSCTKTPTILQNHYQYVNEWLLSGAMDHTATNEETAFPYLPNIPQHTAWLHS